jgi:hypothetical protein
MDDILYGGNLHYSVSTLIKSIAVAGTKVQDTCALRWRTYKMQCVRMEALSQGALCGMLGTLLADHHALPDARSPGFYRGLSSNDAICKPWEKALLLPPTYFSDFVRLPLLSLLL